MGIVKQCIVCQAHIMLMTSRLPHPTQRNGTACVVRANAFAGPGRAHTCTLMQLERCPVSVRATLACSRSQSLSVPPADPAMTVCSLESKLTHSTALVCPERLCVRAFHTGVEAPAHDMIDSLRADSLTRQTAVRLCPSTHILRLCPKPACMRGRTIIALARPMAHTFTFLSSPPVTMTEPDLRPICMQFTVEPCATNSSATRRTRAHLRQQSQGSQTGGRPGSDAHVSSWPSAYRAFRISGVSTTPAIVLVGREGNVGRNVGRYHRYRDHTGTGTGAGTGIYKLYPTTRVWYGYAEISSHTLRNQREARSGEVSRSLFALEIECWAPSCCWPPRWSPARLSRRFRCTPQVHRAREAPCPVARFCATTARGVKRASQAKVAYARWIPA